MFHTHPLFDLKIIYSYKIDVADSKSDFGFYNKGLVSNTFASYYLPENALRRPKRRGHVRLVPNNACPDSAHL